MINPTVSYHTIPRTCQQHCCNGGNICQKCLIIIKTIMQISQSQDKSTLCSYQLVISTAHDGSRHFDPAPENILRSVWNAVPDVPGRPVPVRLNRSLSISSNSDRVWCTAGVHSWPYLVPAVHCRPDSADPGSRSLPTSVRRRHTDLRVLPTVCITGAPEHYHQLC